MSVPRSRKLSRWVVILSLLVGFGTPVALSDVEGGEFLSGVVRDSIGNVMADVELLVVRSAADPLQPAAPLAVVRSDAGGRFRIAHLAPGAYRVAALKDGYLTAVSRVDTSLGRFVQVVLHPMPELADEAPTPVPARHEWGFRIPRRGLLREIDSAQPGDANPVDVAGRAEDGLTDRLFRMQVEQWFAVATPLKRAGTNEPSALQGSETRVQLASALGERGSMELFGRRESLESSFEDVPGHAAASRDAASLSLALSYDTSLDSQVEVRAFYGERNLSLAPNVGPATLPSAPVADVNRQQQIYWGYDASWSKRLDPRSTLELALDYHDSRLHVPAAGGAALLARPDGVTELTNRTVGAAGLYESVPATDHRVQVDFRAQLLDAPSPEMRAYGSEVVGAFRGVSGVSLGLNAQDTWSVGGPFALIYGLGYKHAMATHDASLIAPRVGAAFSRDDLMLELVLSYHDVTIWGRDDSVVGLVPFQPVGEMGYEAMLEVPLVAEVRLNATSAYTPVQFDYLGYADGRWTEDLSPIFLTDGNAAVRQDSVALVRDVGPTRTFLEVSHGKAEGMLSATPLLTVTPLQVLAERDLRFDTGRLGVRIQPSGTDLLLEYQEVTQGPLYGGPGLETLQRSVELRLIQDLLRMRTLGSWRFLMAVRSATLESVDGEDLVAGERGDAELLNSLNQQISAGLSVTF